MQIESYGDNLHEVRAYYLGKITKISSFFKVSAEFAHSMESVNAFEL